MLACQEEISLWSFVQHFPVSLRVLLVVRKRLDREPGGLWSAVGTVEGGSLADYGLLVRV